jgi:hypothetical protein
MLAEDLVVNDAVYRWLHAERRSSVALDAALKRAGEVFGRRCVFCADDPRFVLRHDEVHLAASELSRQPVVEDNVGDLEKYRTHLPLHSLKAAAASEPAGEWGKRAQDQVIETLGWVRVSLPGRRLNDRMFIAAIEGHSMDDGKSGLVDGGYAVFELWPSGTKQNLSVLVRGAFSDPETGNYAVKKYVADQRDEEGRHNKVSLVSLNPNKERYPNIELQPEDDDDITVVAKVVQALSTDDYERRPKASAAWGGATSPATSRPRGSGVAWRRSSTAGARGRRRRSEHGDEHRLADAAGVPRRRRGRPAARGRSARWPADLREEAPRRRHRVGCLRAGANAKTRPTRVSVRPGTGPWRWEAVGFEEEQDLGVDQLALDALDVTRRRVPRRRRRRGPAHQEHHARPRAGVPAAAPAEGRRRPRHRAGRRLAHLVTRPRGAALAHDAATLTALGLDVGEAWPRLEWALAPAAWRTNARGDSYPVFEAGTELLVNVGGVSVEDGDEAVLFLHGPAGTERLPLSSSGLVSLGAPAAGRWACALLHADQRAARNAALRGRQRRALEDVSVVLAVAVPAGWRRSKRRRRPGGPSRCAGASSPPTKRCWRRCTATTMARCRSRRRVASRSPRRACPHRRPRRRLRRAGAPLASPRWPRVVEEVREQLTRSGSSAPASCRAARARGFSSESPWFEPSRALRLRPRFATLLADVEAPHDLTAWASRSTSA